MPEKCRRYLLPAAVSVLALAVVCGFAAFTLPSADDYMYASFLDGGARAFLARMAEHYRVFNGRVLVHAAAAVILRLGSWSFAVLCPLTVAAVPAFAALSERRGRGFAVAVTAVFTAAFLSLPRKVLGWGVYWVAAFCNYALPTAMLCVLLYSGVRALEGKRDAAWLTPVLAFLCGATTEQSGVLAAALALYFAIRSFRVRRARLPLTAGVPAAAAGLYTIFLSPATASRARTETGITSLSGLLRALPAGLGRVAEELHTDGWFAPLMLAAFFLLTALSLKRRGKGRLWLFALAAAGAALAGGFSGSWLLWTAVFLLAALAAAALMALKRETPAILALLGLLSLAVMVPTTSIAGRTVMPFYLFLLAAVSTLIAGEAKGKPALTAAVPAAILCLSLLTVVPMARGFAQNDRVERQNEENALAARETGVLNYCVDYDYRYTWTKMNASFAQDYLALHGLPADTKLNWYAELRPQVYVNGEKQYPAYLPGDGTALLTLRLLEAMGGTIEPNPNYDHLIITLPWRTVYVDLEIGGAATLAVAGGETRRVQSLSMENRTWFAPEIYEDVFDLQVTYDEAERAFHVAAPEGGVAGES